MTEHAGSSAFFHNHAEGAPEIPVYRAISHFKKIIGECCEVLRTGCHNLWYYGDAGIQIGLQFTNLRIIGFHFFRRRDKRCKGSINAPEINRKQVAVYPVRYSLDWRKVDCGMHFKPVMTAIITAVFFFSLFTG